MDERHVIPREDVLSMSNELAQYGSKPLLPEGLERARI
jgi:hypothetical protein